MLRGMRTPRSLWGAGLGLLGFSLLMTLLLTTQQTSARSGLVLLGWFTQAALYVGSGFVIGGAVVHVLRSPDPGPRQRDEAPFGQTDYWGG